MINNILSHTQVAFLREVGASNLAGGFYLTGGTSLAAFYLKHRYSEDLDFFSEQEFDAISIDVFLKSVRRKLGFTAIDFQQSYNRNLFFCHLKNGVLKTEFTYFPFSRIERGKYEYGITIDSLLDIAVNKLFAIYQRTHARDYVDLFFIIKEYNFSILELARKARAKFDWHIDPLQLGTQFVKVMKVKDYPRMIKPLDEKELVEFFIKESKALTPKIME